MSFCIFLLKNKELKQGNPSKTEEYQRDLEPDDLEFNAKNIRNNLIGYDIEPRMVKFAKVLLYFNKVTKSNIHEYDSLTQDSRWNENADVVIRMPTGAGVGAGAGAGAGAPRPLGRGALHRARAREGAVHHRLVGPHDPRVARLQAREREEGRTCAGESIAGQAARLDGEHGHVLH